MSISYKPMLASIGSEQVLQDQNYIFEPKLDGFRAICIVHNKTMKLVSRNEINITHKYPELSSIADALAVKSCVLDGEIVAFDKHGVPQFQILLQRDQRGIVTAKQEQFARIQYIVFDVLMYNNRSCLQLPLLERKKVLHKIVKGNAAIQVIPYTGQGLQLWQWAKKHDFEGVMAKRQNGHYYPGKRTKEWLKVKFHKDIDCIIVGYTMEKRKVSSLLLGVYNAQKELQYIGKVGTGFSEKDIALLYSKLKPLETKKSPLVEVPMIRGTIIWVKPKLVCQIQYKQVTQDLRLRIAVFIRLRTDKKPKECTLGSQMRLSK